MKRTLLYEKHVELGARMVPFANWEMPVFYTTVIDEHLTVRSKVGLFDICHMGEFIVKGKGAFDFLQYVMTNDLNKLVEGKAFYSAMCNENGGVIDDLFIYMISKEEYMVVVNAANVEKDFVWLKKYSNGFDVELDDISEETAKLDLQGPLAQQALQKLVNYDLDELKRFYFVKIKVNDIICTVSRTGYTGDDGFELYFDISKANEVWNAVLDAGDELGIKPIGLGARDTLRVEACYSLYGHELNESISPFEAGTGFVVKMDKEDFIGKSALEKIKESYEYHTVAFELLDKGVPRQGYEVMSEGKFVGKVTSGTMSPTFKKGIGLACVQKSINAGSEIHINIRGRPYKALVVKRPIYNFRGGK